MFIVLCAVYIAKVERDLCLNDHGDKYMLYTTQLP